MTPRRDQTVKAFAPAGWAAPRTVTPERLAQQPLILTGRGTRRRTRA